jgi:tetratricopeptide (TPR) repeat protein
VEAIVPQKAEAYTELGNVYGAQEGKESKAENSYQLARELQDIFARSKQGEGANEDPKSALAAYELMADAYAGLGKYDRADSFYGTAAEIASSPMLSADTDRLTLITILHKRAVLNREHLHYEKAEEYYKKLLEIVKATPANTPIGLPEALRDLGGLYATEMNRPAEAEPLLKSSLEFSRSGKSMLEVNKTLAELVKLYRRQNRTAELENAQKTRAENAGKILAVRREAGADSLTAFKDYTEGAREYIEANGDLASRYQSQKKDAEALSLYRMMLGDPTKPESNPGSCCVMLDRLTETSVIDLYARTLDQYRQLLLARGMTDEAAKIASYLKDVESQKGLALLYRRYQHL